MATALTRKTSDDHRAPPLAGVLIDPSGQPAPPAPLLAAWVPAAGAPSHGTAPEGSAPAPGGWLDLGPAAALRVTGPERESWVQGVQTNDVRAAPAGGAVYTLFLGARGRVVADGHVFRSPDALVLTTRPDRLEALHAHLDKLLIMEDAELSRAEGLHRLRWAPGGGPLAARAAASPEVAAALEGVRGSPDALGFELLVDEATAQRLLAALPERADPEALEALRLWRGVPAWGQDFDAESTPLEAGLDRAISFDKGCYVGQEVVAMATFRGRVQWNLVRLRVEGAAPAVGSALDPARPGRGKVTSAVQRDGDALLLGVVHRDRIVPDSQVPLADGRVATVLGLPFESRPGAGVCA